MYTSKPLLLKRLFLAANPYSSAKYLLHRQYYKVTKLQHLTVVAYCSSLFAADFTPMIRYFTAVLDILLYIKF